MIDGRVRDLAPKSTERGPFDAAVAAVAALK